MDQHEFIEKTPYLYHLTDRRNLDFVLGQKRLLSAVALTNLAGLENKKAFLQARRPEHVTLTIDGKKIHIRDQRPLNKALDNCLTDGWNRAQFIYHLNSRVFTWPNLKRLRIHYGRYAEERPVILRLDTADVLALNDHAEITHINSGATRPSGALKGKAAARGKDTFKPFAQYDRIVSSVAEVTFPGFCHLPDAIRVGNSPEGRWRVITL